MGKAESKAAALLGRKGGAAGKGSVKVRGSTDHYRAIVALRPDRKARVEWLEAATAQLLRTGQANSIPEAQARALDAWNERVRLARKSRVKHA